jgi:undecaprenyl phosphate N,N'-diacetylbacillosamine 1-phosphate transferase
LAVYQSFIKPFFDKLIALVVLFITAPVFLLVMILLALANNGKIWFRQARPGYKEKTFHVLKFKTMNDNRDEQGHLLSDKERLTSIGKFIRKTSIDELPQLINVLKGEMSLIGPRPLLVEYLGLYDNIQRKRHNVKPGITGWAQVNGRNAISWQEKFSYDIWYVENMSFSLDLKILLLTLIRVFRADGINKEGLATADKFTGGN